MKDGRVVIGGPPFREPRIDQVLLARVGTIVALVCGLAIVGTALTISPQITVRGSHSYRAAEERQLLAELYALKSSWDPRERAQLLAAAPEHAAEFAGPLGRFLRGGHDELLAVGVEYAGALGQVELRPLVVELLDSRVRDVPARAVLAADALEPWSDGHLAGFLTDEMIRPVQVAALDIVARTGRGPWRQVVERLLSEHDDVREAAVRAIPPAPPPEILEALRSVLTFGEEDQLVAAFQAVARVRDVAAEFEELIVTEFLELASPAVQLAALEVLAAKRGALRGASEVWRLAVDPDAAQAVRSSALYCLERTGGFEVERVRAALPYFEPLPRHFAARCLLSAGQEDAVEVLIGIVEDRDRDGDERAVTAARQLLAWLTGLTPSSGPERFRDAFVNGRIDGNRALPAPHVDFDAP